MELIGHMKNKLLFLSLLTFFFAGCDSEKDKPSTADKEPVKQVSVPEFNSDSAYIYVEDQVNFGPRVPNTAGHLKTGNYLINKLKSFGAEVKVQEFQAEAYNGKKLDLRNIIGSYNPSAKKRILLAAHWDTRPFADQDEKNPRQPILGANDGGSGVGVLLEVARILQNNKPDVGVDIIFFDGEDYGQPDFDAEEEQKNNTWCLGSQHWSENKHVPGYSAYYGILLDMVGAKGASFAMEGTSMHYAPAVMQKVWKQAHAAGYSDYFNYQNAPAIIDDHTYVNSIAGIPMIDIIEFNPAGENYFGEYWHTHDDDMDVIDRNTLKAVGQTLLEVLYRE